MITAWICTLGVVYWLRFLGGKWRTMRVIEPEIERGTWDEFDLEPALDPALDIVAETA
jgi:hypothetical protein